MRVSVVAGLIIGVHVAVIGSVVMTQGCTSTQSGAGSTVPAAVEPAPPPVLPPSAAVAVPVQPVAFPVFQPPAEPAPLKTDVAAENVYVVRPGDSLSKIAAAHGVKTAELKELNKIADENKIRADQKLILPDYAKPSQSPPKAKAPAAAKAAAKETAKEPPAPVVASGDSYVVKAGDSLSKIATAHGVKVADLKELNKIADANKIRIGQKLAIPAAKPAKKDAEAAPKAEAAPAAEAPVAPLPSPVPEIASAAVPEPAPAAPSSVEGQEAMLDYTVQDGDTLEGIARLFVVRQEDIRRANGLAAGDEVRSGQTIKIPPASL